jgi:hypothetical protein
MQKIRRSHERTFGEEAAELETIGELDTIFSYINAIKASHS